MAVETHPRAATHAGELALLVLVGFLWGAQFGLTKIQLETLAPVTGVAIRLWLGAAFLWIVVAVQRGGIPRGIKRWRDFAIQGLLTSAGPGVMIAWGQQYVDSAFAAILNSSSPILVMLITLAYTRHERIGARRLAGLAVGLGGVVLMIGIEALGGISRGLAGQIVIMLATFGYASATIFGRRFVTISPVVAAAATTTASAVMMTLLAFAAEAPLAAQPSLRSFLATAASGILCTGLGVVIYFRLIGTLGSLGTSTVSFLKAAFGVLVGCLILAEPFTATIAIGLIAVLIGVVAVNDGSAGKGSTGR